MTNKSSFNLFLKNELNQAQKEAVLHDSGALLVIAGAGSGKTRVITARITHLIINKNVLPSTIVALTFTNKAANEMKKRIAQFLGTNTRLPFVGTFHSYCVQLLKKNSALLPSPFFSILDEDDKQKLIKAILQRNNLHKQFTARSVSYQISQMKNHTTKPATTAQNYLASPLLFDIYQTYEKEKRASKCLDFDDLLLETFHLFNKNQTFKNIEQEKIKHILVDEYQDTNVIQHALLKQMATQDKQLTAESICAVGDEDQSIYSWRGATIANILNFKKDFSSTQIIKIEQNYRSVQSILDVANKVIKNNTARNPKKLWSNKHGYNRVQILSCLSEYQEAEIIAQLLTIIEQKQKLNTVAILYRTHTQSRAIEEALIKQTIPYKIIGGIQFYERKEIKDLLAHLRLIVNPFDRTSFFRIVNVPARGLGAKFEEQFFIQWQQQPFLTFQQLAAHFIKEKIIPSSKANALQKFINIFDGLEPTQKTSNAIEHIVK
ncbi:MAG: UvrD-helicase domain-containing protein, partial [Candidatus Babeliales bacterium]